MVSVGHPGISPTLTAGRRLRRQSDEMYDIENARAGDAGARVGTTGRLSTCCIPSGPGTQHLPESDVQRVTNASAAGLLKPFSCAINLQKTAAVRTYTAMMMTTTEPTVYSVARTSWLCLVAWPSCRPLGLAASWRYIGRAGLRRASEEDYHSFRRPSHFTISIGPESGSGLVVGPTLNGGAWSARAMTACGTRPTFNG